MTAPQFYRAYVWAPLVFSGIATLALWLGWQPESTFFGVLTGTLFFSGIYGGIPYAFVATWATLWLRGKSLDQIHWLAMRMPLLFILVFVVCAVLFGRIAEASWESGAALALIGTVYIIPIGYMYVGLGFLLERLLRRRHWPTEPHSMSA
jgi:hypothetical protein